MAPLSRRDFIEHGAASTLATMLPSAAGAAGAATGASLNDIDHFIIVMQENRSFDHYFGTLRGVRGFDDPAAIGRGSENDVFRQPDPRNRDGHVLPFRLDTLKTSAQRLQDLSHEVIAQHQSLAGGRMNGFVTAHRQSDGGDGPLTMGYYTREDLPFYYALADAFTICDGYHCSMLGPTHPNRIYSLTGTIDPSGKLGGPVVNNSASRGDRLYRWETYPERLERAGISWQMFHDTGNNPFDILRYFGAYRNASPGSALYEKARRGRPIKEFLNDLRTGNLPQVTWVLPEAAYSEHPNSLPAAGEHFVGTILRALWSNPALWARTAVIINYDENDGQFDHVFPPIAVPGTTGEEVHGFPIGLGFRVPCLVISPYSRGGYVCGDTFDHTSVLRLLEARFGVEVPNLTPWRRAVCGDLTSAFGFADGPRLDIPELPETADALDRVEATVGKLPAPFVPSVQVMATQEPGTRSRRGIAARA